MTPPLPLRDGGYVKSGVLLHTAAGQASGAWEKRAGGGLGCEQAIDLLGGRR